MKRLPLLAAFALGAVVVIGILGSRTLKRSLDRLEEALFI